MHFLGTDQTNRARQGEDIAAPTAVETALIVGIVLLGLAGSVWRAHSEKSEQKLEVSTAQVK